MVVYPLNSNLEQWSSYIIMRDEDTDIITLTGFLTHAAYD